MEEKQHKQRVHKILAQSYATYLVAFLVGLILDSLFPVTFFQSDTTVFFGAVLILFGTFLIIQAQRTSRKYGDTKKEHHLDFYHGLYKITRSPTHLGLALLVTGFGFLTGSLFVFICGVISAVLTKVTFLRKQEHFLEEKYGEIYATYKKMVKF